MKSAVSGYNGALLPPRRALLCVVKCRSVFVMVILVTAFGVPSASAEPPFQEGVAATPNPVSGRDRESVDQITPADCLARVRLLADEIEEIRRVMGKPKTQSYRITIEGAQPREVLYQARTLYHNANRFAIEQTRASLELPGSEVVDIRPLHVWKIIDASLRRVLDVKHRFGIDARFVEVEMPESTTPSEVFISIMNTNRLLNSLLKEQLASANVFQQVTVAVHYASRLQEPFGQSVATISTPEFEPAKTSADVYARLQDCFEIIHRMGHQAGVKVLTLTQPDIETGDVIPSDAYAAASLIVAELAYFHSRLPGLDPPERAYFPGIKFPSHVLQRVELLRRQLLSLEQLQQTNRNPIK